MEHGVSATITSHPIIPYLIVDGAAAAIDFYTRAFGAVERYRLAEPNGRIAHAELALEGASFMLADEYPEQAHLGPKRLGGSSCSLALHVADVERSVARALDAGASLERATRDEFYGERVGLISDPFGHRWSLRQVLESLSPDAITQRFHALLKGERS
jgi:PhnB protein